MIWKTIKKIIILVTKSFIFFILKMPFFYHDFENTSEFFLIAITKYLLQFLRLQVVYKNSFHLLKNRPFKGVLEVPGVVGDASKWSKFVT